MTHLKGWQAQHFRAAEWCPDPLPYSDRKQPSQQFDDLLPSTFSLCRSEEDTRNSSSDVFFFYQLSQFILRKLSDVSCQVFWDIGYNDAKWHSLFNGTEQDGNCNVVFQWLIVTRVAVKRHLFFCLLATTGTILMSSSLQHDRQHVL